ncbi:SOS response-associated peptidase [Capilliphycus salinus ALCB114379]|uniref:SOS response-associated peptidase n=1 Tax=Capilliphycus salinus TaxID=2768948 RepID=UPI0039A725C2
MCGRFTLTCLGEQLAEIFQLSEVPEITPRYNIAPTQLVATVSINSKSEKRQLNWMRWGLIPSWAKDQKMGAKLINARVETVAEKPSFRQAIRQRRCLIVADGFYEWQKIEDQKQPYYLHVENHQPFGFAGLWERWKSPENEEIISCTILTTEANNEVRSIHHRQPIIIPENNYSQWLDPQLTEPQEILPLLTSQPPLNYYPVNAVVNNSRHDQADCIEQKG